MITNLITEVKYTNSLKNITTKLTHGEIDNLIALYLF